MKASFNSFQVLIDLGGMFFSQILAAPSNMRYRKCARSFYEVLRMHIAIL